MAKRMKLIDRVLHKFGYDAVKDNGRRKPPRTTNYSEDNELPDYKRRKMTATTRDVQRNFAVASWAIRKHLDYVSAMNFQSKSGDEAFDKRLEEVMAWWSRPENCDVRKKHSLSKMIRIGEQSRTIDGDVLMAQLRNGRLQAIESDRLATPTGGKVPRSSRVAQTVQGVQLDREGAPVAYLVNKRGSGYGSMEFDRALQARNVFHLGYFDRFDQVRGISRLAAAVNTYQDLYEGLTYALAKTKISQLFGLVTFRDSPTAIDDVVAYTDSDGETRYDIDFGVGPYHLDLDDGDKAEILESKTPSQEMQDFSQVMIMLALKSLDIPYSFYAENFTNYSGARQAILQYEKAAADKRQDNIDLLNWITRWKVRTWVASGLLEMPAGIDNVRNIKWEWIASGIPWIDPLKEVKAQREAIAEGLISRQRVTKSQGMDFFEIANELEEEQKYMKTRGIAFGSEQGEPQDGETEEEPEGSEAANTNQ